MQPPINKSIPKLSGWPVLENTVAYLQNPLAVFKRALRECGDIAQYRVGPANIVQVNSPQLIESFLVKHFQDIDKGNPGGNLFFPFIGNGLLISEGSSHQSERSILQPIFQTDHLTQYSESIIAFADRHQAGWNEGSELDITQEMSKLTMSIISKLVLDTEILYDQDNLGKAYAQALSWINDAILHPLHLPLDFPNAANKATKAAIETLKAGIGVIIRAHHRPEANQTDILAAMLAARDPAGGNMSDTQAYNEIITIFGAGQATLATALVWTWYLLAKNPPVYTRVQQEVDRVLQGRLPGLNDLAQLPYLSQVFNEVLRLYPPTSLLARKALYDTDFNGYPIKTNTTLLVSVYAVHRWPQYFANPERFDPERFNPENAGKLPPFAFIPFGVGARSCLGEHLAPLEAKLILATLLQKVSLELVEASLELEPELAFSLRPKSALKLRVKRRNS